MTKINEIYVAPQGEGTHTGIPMLFVRLQGCPLRCSFCDSSWTWDFRASKNDATDMNIEEAVRATLKSEVKWVCLTGGEPVAPPFKPFVKFYTRLVSIHKKIEVFTSGYLIPESDVLEDVESWVVDIKCPSSNMSKYSKNAIEWPFRPRDQAKFVVGTQEDLAFVEKTVPKLRGNPTILVSPAFPYEEYKPELTPQQVSNFVKEHPGLRLSLQTHKYLWGDQRGK